mgnify:CR=1 FL=1
MVSDVRQSDGVLVSPEQLHRWQHERERLASLIDEMQKRRSAIDRLIEAAMPFMGAMAQEGAQHVRDIVAEARAHPQPLAPSSSGAAVEQKGEAHESPDKAPRGVWTATIRDALSRAPEGMTFGELKDEIQNGPLGDRLAQTSKSFYGAIGKLESRGVIAKHRGWLFTAETLDQFLKDVAAGKVADKEPLDVGRGSPMQDVVIELVRSAQPEGIKSSEVVAALRNHPEFGASVIRNATAGYNIISRLLNRGELMKEGRVLRIAPKGADRSARELTKDENGTLRLPQDENEPHAREGGGSDTEGDATLQSSHSFLD